MGRFLFVVPPFAGHINPTVSVGRTLGERGHEVAWVGHERVLTPLLYEGAQLIPISDGFGEETLLALRAKSDTVRGLASMRFLWEDVLGPLARSMRPSVEAAVERFRPEVMIADQQALAGPLVARLRGLPFATFTTSAAGVVENPLPLVWQWVLDQLAELQRQVGLPVVERPDISPELMVVFTTPALAGPGPYPAHYRFVGPAIGARGSDVPFPWEQLRQGPRILVSLGTVNAQRGEAFYRALKQVLADAPVQVILAAPRDQVGEVPPNFLARDYVPQLALLPQVNAVVCHAGQNTVSEALAHGIPLVVTPIKDDQGLIATQVVACGAGLRVRYGRLRPSELGQAIARVLSEPGFREAALAVKASFEAAGGASRAADYLEEFLGQKSATSRISA